MFLNDKNIYWNKIKQTKNVQNKFVKWNLLFKYILINLVCRVFTSPLVILFISIN